MRAASRIRTGALVTAVYVATVALTLLSSHVVRPLFEGFSPPPPYQWVKPPASFAANNITPKPSSSDIPLSGGKSPPAVAATPDGQFVVDFSAGTFVTHGADTGVHAALTPLDPATLGPVPSGGCPDGNAYRIDLDYRPSSSPVTELSTPGDVIMTAPSHADGLLFSADGKTWAKLAKGQAVGGPSTWGAPFTQPGYYLADAAASSGGCASGGSKGSSGTVLIAVWVAAGAVVLGLVGFALTRRRNAAKPAPRRPAARGSGSRSRRPPSGGRRR